MKTFLEILNALPAIIQSVQTVESAFPVSRSGQQKLNVILGAAGAAWELGEAGRQLSKANTLTAIEAIANLTVAGLNAAGVFKHSTPVSSN